MDIADLGIKVDSRQTERAAKELDALAVSAARAETAADGLHESSRRVAPAMGAAGQQSRMFAMQLSQVAQQASATGNYTQALAIQLPDMAMGFGAVGIAAGALAGVVLPALVSMFTSTAAEANAATEALKALAQAQIDAQGNIDKLRFGVDEAYQVELLKEQIRLRDEYTAKYAEASRIAQTFGNDERARTQYIADSRVELDKIKARYDEIGAALSNQQNRSAQLSVLQGIAAQKAGEMAAKQRDTAAETEKVNGALRAAGMSAADIAAMNFANIDQARAFAEGLAGALASAANYASFLSSTGQSSGPDAARSIVQFGGPVAMQPSGAGMAYVAPAGGGGGGGGGGGANPYADKLQSLVESLRSEREIETEWYEENLAILADRRAQEVLGQQAHQDALVALHEEYRSRIAEIDANSYSKRLGESADFFGALAGIAQAGGQRMAKVAAAAGAIEGTINAYRAALQALADPTIGFWGKAAAYASVLGAGLKGVAAIRSAGGIGGGGGSSIAAQGITSQAAGPMTEYRIYGLDRARRYTGEEIALIFDGLVEENKRRGTGGMNVTFV